MENKFFVSVNDVRHLFARYNVNSRQIMFYEDVEPQYPNEIQEPIEDTSKIRPNYRIMSERFSKDIPTAIVRVIADNSYETMQDPEFVKFIKENIQFDETKNAYILYEYFTLGSVKEPKQCQWDEFYKGNYTFNVIMHEVQVFETVQAGTKDVLNTEWNI